MEVSKEARCWVDQIEDARWQAAKQFYRIGEGLYNLSQLGWTVRDITDQWEEYSKSHIDRFIQAYKVIEYLSPIGDKNQLPRSEGVTRGLTKFLDRPDILKRVWQKTLQLTGGYPPTCRHVQAAVDEINAGSKLKLEQKKEAEKKRREKEIQELKKLDDQIIEIEIEEVEIEEDAIVDEPDIVADPEDLEGYKEEKRKLRREISDKDIAMVAEQVWKSIRSNEKIWKQDALRIAKCTIKMLYAKYPQLMDEPIESD